MLRRGIFWGLVFLSGQLAHAQVTFIIEELPGATHSSDTIFISGSFNNWIPNDKQCMVNKQLNGQLSVTLLHVTGEIEYKFTRGSWNKVETDEANRLIANRKLTVGNNQTVHVQIENWLDLGGARQLNYLIFYFFACAFQGIALCFLISRMSKPDPARFKYFLMLNALMISTLLLAVLHEIVNPVWQSYFVFAFNVAAFCWGPFMLLFLNAFSGSKSVENIRLFFIPVALTVFIVLLRIANFRFLDFLSVITVPPLTLGHALFILVSFSFTLIVFIRSLRLCPPLKAWRIAQHDKRISFVYYFYWLSFLSLLLVPVNALLIVNGFRHSFFEDFHIVGLSLSALIFLQTYFLWRYPEIIKQDRIIHINTDDNREWLEKLNLLMKAEKPYRHSDLSVSDLADMLGTRPHVLSRVINDNHHKNFRDFVNAYRVEEFISLANMQQYKHYTFLALAQEVGFNSKSTFNLAFKKLTRQNPREYFKTHA